MKRTPPLWMKRTPTLRPRVGPRWAELILAGSIRRPAVFQAIAEKLQPQMLSRFGAAHELLWHLTRQFHAEHQRLPTTTELSEQVTRCLEADLELRHRVDRDRIEQVLHLADTASCCRSGGSDDVLIAKAKQLLEEALIADLAKQLSDSDGMVPADLPAVIEAAQAQAGDIAAMDVPLFDLLPPGWDTELRVDTVSTGLPFFDALMGGGQVAGEVYALLGPYGGGKTTLATMLAVEAARRFAGLASADPQQPKAVAFLLSYEMTLTQMRPNVMSYAAGVARDSLARMDSREDLSRQGELLPYESELYAQEIALGADPPGEQERCEAARVWLRPHLCVLDASAMNAAASVVARIDAVLRSRRARCGLIIVDYAGALVWREVTKVDPRTLQRKLAALPLRLKTELALKHQCPVWLLHQLSGEANRRRKLLSADHTDAAECRSFAENLDFAFVLGRSTEQNLSLLRCTKHRRCDAAPDQLLRMDPVIYRFLGCGGAHVRDPITERVLQQVQQAV